MSEISIEEPKRCPFCGWGTIVEGGILFSHKCECNGCHASTGSYRTWEDAVKAWNRRDYSKDFAVGTNQEVSNLSLAQAISNMEKLEKIEQIVNSWDFNSKGNFKDTFGLMSQIEQIVKG